MFSLRDPDTQHVCRLCDLTKAPLIRPVVAHAVAGNVVNRGQRYLVIATVRPAHQETHGSPTFQFRLTAQQGRLSANPGLFPLEQDQRPHATSVSGVKVVVCAMLSELVGLPTTSKPGKLLSSYSGPNT